MASDRSNTADKQPKGKRKMPKGEPFKKGYDPRRNMKGRPKAFDGWRALGVDIGEQIATTRDGKPILWNGQEITFAEFVQLTWITDKKYMENWAEVAYGNPPKDVNLYNPDGSLNDTETIYNRIMARIESRLANGDAERTKEDPERDDGGGA